MSMSVPICVPENETWKSVLLKIEDTLLNLNHRSSYKHQLEELAAMLLAIAREDLETCRKEAKRRNLPWEGKLPLFGSAREQDGLNWGNSESVEIRSGEIALLSRSSRATKGITEEEEMGIVITGDEEFLKRAYCRSVKKFINPEETILIHVMSVMFNKSGSISRITSRRNSDPLLNEKDSFYYRPQKQYTSYELRLP